MSELLDGHEPSPRRRAEGMRVVAVARSGGHTFSKPVVPVIRLLRGLGVEDDAHAGVTARHRGRVQRDPTQPNRRQVHLMHAELHTELAAAGFRIGPGEMGENVTTTGLDLLSLPLGTWLRLGPDAVVEVTGLRSPCAQLNGLAPGLMSAVIRRNPHGRLVRKTGVMAVVVSGGEVIAGDTIGVDRPEGLHLPLRPV